MSLLRSCRSIKVRRLFFVFADRHEHAWLKHLDKDAIDFGSGPRAPVKGGKLHPTYRIYVPEDLLPADVTEGATHACAVHRTSPSAEIGRATCRDRVWKYG